MTNMFSSMKKVIYFGTKYFSNFGPLILDLLKGFFFLKRFN